jgi:hypothetical protein
MNSSLEKDAEETVSLHSFLPEFEKCEQNDTCIHTCVPHKNGLEPLQKIEPLNGVVFTLPTNKMLNFSRIDKS